MQLLGFILRFFNDFVHNYGVAIILFTIFVKILLIPLTMKQQKSMLEMQKIQPLLKELQEKYKNDKEKLNMETMKLYKENGVNPMAGCLPLLIQMPILLSLWWVIRAPITYMLGADVEQLTLHLHYWVYNSGWIAANVPALAESMIESLQSAFYYVCESTDVIYRLGTSGFAEHINSDNIAAGWRAFESNQIELARYLYSVREVPLFAEFTAVNFRFLGLDLSTQPIFGFNLPLWGFDRMWIIPILAGGTTFLSSRMMQKLNPTPSMGADGKNPMQSMMYFFPLFTVFLSFTFPAGVGLYWIVSNLLQTLQQWGVNAYLRTKKPETEVIKVNAEKNRDKRKKH